MSQTWICQGPSGVYGEGIVGDGWTSCIHNYVPTLPKQCQDTFPSLQQAKQSCQRKLLREMDPNPFQFKPKLHSCIIDKSKTQCQGKYRTQFLKQSNPPSYYNAMGNTHSMETHFMDIPFFHRQYLDKLKQDKLRLQAIEQKRIKQRQFEEQELQLQQKLQEEKKQKEKLYRERIEQEIKNEIKEEIYSEMGNINDMKQKLKLQLLKQQTLLKQERTPVREFDPDYIQKVNQQIKSLQTQITQKENEEISELNKALQEIQSKDLSQKQEYLLMKQELDKLVNPPPQEVNLPNFLDSLESFLLSVLESDKRYEPFSNKPNTFPMILLILGLLLFLSFCKLK